MQPSQVPTTLQNIQQLARIQLVKEVATISMNLHVQNLTILSLPPPPWPSSSPPPQPPSWQPRPSSSGPPPPSSSQLALYPARRGSPSSPPACPSDASARPPPWPSPLAIG